VLNSYLIRSGIVKKRKAKSKKNYSKFAEAAFMVTAYPCMDAIKPKSETVSTTYSFKGINGMDITITIK
jgi:hypothetical protein